MTIDICPASAESATELGETEGKTVVLLKNYIYENNELRGMSLAYIKSKYFKFSMSTKRTE